MLFLGFVIMFCVNVEIFVGDIFAAAIGSHKEARVGNINDGRLG